MKKYGIPTAKYETFDDPASVMAYIRAEGKYPVVIKADGLALGKGVLICQNEQEAADGVKEIMLDKKFGASRQPCGGRGVPHRARGQRAVLLPMARPSCPWSPAWTTSVRWTVTRA